MKYGSGAGAQTAFCRISMQGFLQLVTQVAAWCHSTGDSRNMKDWIFWFWKGSEKLGSSVAERSCQQHETCKPNGAASFLGSARSPCEVLSPHAMYAQLPAFTCGLEIGKHLLAVADKNKLLGAIVGTGL